MVLEPRPRPFRGDVLASRTFEGQGEVYETRLHTRSRGQTSTSLTPSLRPSPKGSGPLHVHPNRRSGRTGAPYRGGAGGSRPRVSVLRFRCAHGHLGVDREPFRSFRGTLYTFSPRRPIVHSRPLEPLHFLDPRGLLGVFSNARGRGVRRGTLDRLEGQECSFSAPEGKRLGRSPNVDSFRP